METWNLVWAVLSAAVILLFVLPVCVILPRRIKSKYRVQRMPMREKLEKINALAGPFGFFYVRDWDIFSTRRDAWQRTAGYEALFDAAAPAVHMVMDVCPVYFDYGGRTWLIEFWKGQYGISTGGEVGVYHADGIVAPHQYRFAHYDAAADGELPRIHCRLMRGGQTLYAYESRHWWQTGFAVGIFSKPEQLTLFTAFTFDDPAMAEAFCQGLKRSVGGRLVYEHMGDKVYVHMCRSQKMPGLVRLQRAWAQLWNRIFVRLFLLTTQPFTDSADRILFLYGQLPGCARRIFSREKKRLRHRKKKHRAGACGSEL